MPRRVYSPDEKAAALETLNRLGQDIAATSLNTGIPQRTLYTWRMEEWDQQRQRRQSQPPPPPKEFPEYDNLIDFCTHLRTRMITVFNRIPLDLSHLPPYLQRDREAARLTLIDIILKLTTIVGMPEPEVEEIEYIHEFEDKYPELITTPAPKTKPQPKITHTYLTPDDLPPPGYKNPIST